MHIELKDEQTGETHRLEAEGVTFGRDPARATLVLNDKGVSSVHAKIYGKDGRFWLEDLKSSNGTYIGELRINAPHALSEGLAFSLYRYRFTVSVLVQDGEGTAVVKAPDLSPVNAAAPIADNPTEPIGPPASANTAKARTRTGEGLGAAAEAPANEAPRESNAGFDPNRFMETAKQAAAYYVANTPKLVANPSAFVKATLREERVGALAPFDIMAWMVPSMLLGFVINAAAVLVASAVHGSLGLVTFAVSLALGVVVSPIVGVIAGFIFHPLVGWFVSLLGGTSTPVSRSNYFLAVATAAPLGQIASAIGVLFFLLPVPFVSLVPHILSLAATLVSLYVAYQWFQHFKVAQWFLVVLLVVGGLLTLSTAWTSYDLLRISRFGASFTTTAKESLEVAKALETQAAALHAASVKPKVEDAPAKPEAASKPEPASKPVVATKPVPESKPVLAPAKDKAMTYQEFVQKRDAVEKAIEEDPSLLTRKSGALALYKKLHVETARLEKPAPKGKKKPVPEDKVTKLVREAEIYEATAPLVSELHQTIFNSP